MITPLYFFCFSFLIQKNIIETDQYVGIKYDLIEKQVLISSYLVKNKIPFIIDNEGVINYKKKYQIYVDKSLEESSDISYIEYTEYNSALLLSTILTINNIKHTVVHEKCPTKYIISYNTSDDEIINEILHNKFFPLINKKILYKFDPTALMSDKNRTI